MNHSIKYKQLVVAIAAGFIFTYGCGGEGGPSEDEYKANSTTIDGSEFPATITNTAGSPAAMNIGDVYTVTFDETNNGIIDFSGTDSSAQFILVVSAIDTVQSSRTVQLSDENTEFDISEDVESNQGEKWKDMTVRDALDQQLRGVEMELSANQNHERYFAAKAMLGKSVQKEYRAGQMESFNVLASLSSFSSYKTVQGEVKCVSDNVVFYVDTQVKRYNPSDLTDADVEQLCTSFDKVAGKEFEIFGEPSDINEDGRIAVLMTPQVNRLGAMGGGIITGFFFANDLYSGSNSNNREIIYVLVPDSEGTYGVSISKSFAMDNLLPAVLPHELQHAINYNQKVFVADGSSEENWLNEGLSHFAEDLVGFGQENPSRVEVFLNNPSYYGPITSGSPDLAERGAIYLFLRYLYEQASDGKVFIWNLLHSNLTGTANLEAAFAGISEDFNQVSEFLLRFNATLVMSSFNLSKDLKYSYAERVKNSETNHWEGVCLNCDTEDGRGTILSGISLATYYGVSQINIGAVSSQFYKITSFPQEIKLSANAAGSYGASLIRFK